MKHQHITAWLEQRDPGPWTALEIDAARQAASCPECSRAWAAAQSARTLLQACATVDVAPSPHFVSTLMRSIEVPPPLAVRLWRANARLIYATAACLALLTMLELREESSIRSREYGEAGIDAVSQSVVHDLAMGVTDDDAVNN